MRESINAGAVAATVLLGVYFVVSGVIALGDLVGFGLRLGDSPSFDPKLAARVLKAGWPVWLAQLAPGALLLAFARPIALWALRAHGSVDQSLQQAWLEVGLLLLGLYFACTAFIFLAGSALTAAALKEAQIPIENTTPRVAVAAIQLILGAVLSVFARQISRALSRAD